MKNAGYKIGLNKHQDLT